jgi:hypothetical protein
MILLNDQPYLEWAVENMASSPSLQKRAREALDSVKRKQPVSKSPDEKDAVDQIEQHSERPYSDSRDDLPW